MWVHEEGVGGVIHAVYCAVLLLYQVLRPAVVLVDYFSAVRCAVLLPYQVLRLAVAVVDFCFVCRLCAVLYYCCTATSCCVSTEWYRRGSPAVARPLARLSSLSRHPRRQ